MEMVYILSAPQKTDRRAVDEDRPDCPCCISERSTTTMLHSWDGNAGPRWCGTENQINYAQRSQAAQSHIIRSAR